MDGEGMAEMRTENTVPKDENLKEDSIGEVDSVSQSSNAIFNLLNPEGKTKLKKIEVIQYIKQLDDEDDEVSGLDKAAKLVLKNTHVKKAIHKLMKATGGEYVNKSDLRIMNKRFLDGHLPRKKKNHGENVVITDLEDDESEEEGDVDRKPKAPIGIFKKGVEFSLKSALVIRDYTLKSVSRASTSWMLALVPTTQINTLVSFLLFSYVMTAPFLSWFIPLTVFFISMIIMAISTLRMIRGEKRYQEFKAWAEFLDVLGKSEPAAINTERAHENYVAGHLSQYAHFLIGSVLCIMSYSVCNKSWTPDAELGIFSLAMYLAVVYAYSDFSLLSACIFLCQVVSSLLQVFPAENDGFGHFYSIPLQMLEAEVQLSLSSLLRVAMIIGLASLPAKYKSLKMGILRGVLPHVIGLFWWEFIAIFLSNCTIQSVFRAVLELGTLLFALPLFFVVSLVGILQLMLAYDFTRIAITIVLVTVPTVYLGLWKKRKEVVSALGTLFGATTTKGLLLMCAAVTLGMVMVFYRPLGLTVPKSNLTWRNYRDMCFKTRKHYPGNPTPVAVACHEFRGYGIEWEGVIKYVQVNDIDNKVISFANLMPGTVATWFSCLYGKPYPDRKHCDSLPQSKKNYPPENILCSVAPHAKRPCHLQDYNMYKFSIGVAMPSNNSDDGIVVELLVSHDFRRIVFNLRKGMPLIFKGYLTSEKPTVSVSVLYTKSDVGELKDHVKKYKRIEKTLGSMLDKAVGSIVKFFLHPIVTFKDVEE